MQLLLQVPTVAAGVAPLIGSVSMCLGGWPRRLASLKHKSALKCVPFDGTGAGGGGAGGSATKKGLRHTQPQSTHREKFATNGKFLFYFLFSF